MARLTVPQEVREWAAEWAAEYRQQPNRARRMLMGGLAVLDSFIADPRHVPAKPRTVRQCRNIVARTMATHGIIV